MENQLKVHASMLAALLALTCSTVHADVIIDVTIPDAQVLDFESATLGNISGTDSLFTDFGIGEIGLDGPGNFSDGFGARSNASRALWYDNGGLKIVDPGDPGNAQLGSSWFIDFASLQNYFGFGFHDAISATDFRIEFFDGGVSVGSTVFDVTTADLQEFSFQSTEAFDRVVIQPPVASGTNFGAAIDNLTISAIPEPSGIVLLAIGAVGLIGRRRRIN